MPVFVCVHHARLHVPASLPTTIAGQFAWAPIKAWASTTAGVAEYAARAVARNRTPPGMAEDLAEFGRVATLREKPTWAHDAPEIRAWPIARLLDYSAPSDTTAVPTWTRLLARRNELAFYRHLFVLVVVCSAGSTN